jgi:hypothetical protein
MDHAERIGALLADENPFALFTAAHLLTQRTHLLPKRRLAAKRKLARLLFARDWERQRIVNLFHVIDWIMRLPEELENRLWQDIIEHQGRPTMENYIPRGARIEMRRELAEAKEKAMRDGWQAGLQAGTQEGIQQGHLEGMKEGMHQGMQQGMQRGMKQGLQQGMKQGLQQGMKEGMQQGMQHGQAMLLALQLTRRFGPLPDDVAARIAAASLDHLQDWATAVIDARSLDEIFRRH